MRALTIGRVLGIGLRVAGRVAHQRLEANAHTARSAPVLRVPLSQAPTARQLGHATRQGVGGFFRNVRRASSIVWLQVTGCFFFLPVLAFAPTLWKTRMSYAHGPDHRTFMLCAVLVTVFFYLGVSSFWRAMQRSAEQ